MGKSVTFMDELSRRDDEILMPCFSLIQGSVVSRSAPAYLLQFCKKYNARMSGITRVLWMLKLKNAVLHHTIIMSSAATSPLQAIPELLSKSPAAR